MPVINHLITIVRALHINVSTCLVVSVTTRSNVIDGTIKSSVLKEERASPTNPGLISRRCNFFADRGNGQTAKRTKTLPKAILPLLLSYFSSSIFSFFTRFAGFDVFLNTLRAAGPKNEVSTANDDKKRTNDISWRCIVAKWIGSGTTSDKKHLVERQAVAQPKRPTSKAIYSVYSKTIYSVSSKAIDKCSRYGACTLFVIIYVPLGKSFSRQQTQATQNCSDLCKHHEPRCLEFKRDQSLYRISSDRNFAVHYNVRDASNYLTTNREKQDVHEWRAKTGGKDKKVEEGIKLAQTGCGRYSPTMKMVHLRSTCLVNCTHDWAYVALAFA